MQLPDLTEVKVLQCSVITPTMSRNN